MTLGQRRIACVDCHLIEPEPGTWIQGRCPRCMPYAPKPSRNFGPRPGRQGKPANNRKELTGLQFGRLTVTGYAYTRGKTAYWNCRCECGASCISRGHHLLWGGTRSCGCLAAETARVSGRKSAALRRRNALRGERRHPSPDFTGAKLSPEQVLAIRVEYAGGGVTFRGLAAKYGVSDSAIGALLRQLSWRDVGGPTAGTRNKVSPEDVRSIRAEYAAGETTHKKLAEKFGLTPSAVTQIITRRNWRHID